MFAALLDPVEPTWPSLEGEDWWSLAQAPAAGTPYGRRILHAGPAGEVLLLSWAEGLATAPHDHGGAGGWVRVLHGVLEEQRYQPLAGGLAAGGWRRLETGDISALHPQDVHAMRAVGPTLSLHLYRPLAGRGMRLFGPKGQVLQVGAGCGAWWPRC